MSYYSKKQKEVIMKMPYLGIDKETSIGIMQRIDSDEKATKFLDWLMQNEGIPTEGKVLEKVLEINQ